MSVGRHPSITEDQNATIPRSKDCGAHYVFIYEVMRQVTQVLSSSFPMSLNIFAQPFQPTAQVVLETPSAPEDDKRVLIAVMGATGSGKTTFINIVSGSKLRVGRGLQSCTNAPQLSKPFELDGRWVTLIDTPGFDDTTKSDTDVLTMIAAFLASTYEQGTKLAGVIYMHRISDFRMGGISTRNFRMFRELCGESTLKNVVLVSNMWGEVVPDVGDAREEELATREIFFKPVLDKGAQFLRHDNTAEGAQAILHHIIRNHPLPLHIQCELIEQGKDISETAAGAELNRELNQQIRKYREEMRQLQEEMNEALRLKDEETRQELELETKKLQEEMSRVQNDSQKLASAYGEEKAKLEQRIKEMAEAAQRENERLSATYAARAQQLEDRLHDMKDASDREKAELMNRLHQVQQQRANLGRPRGFFGSIGSALDSLFGW